MLRPDKVVKYVDKKFDWIDSSNASLSTEMGYSAITKTQHNASGASNGFNQKTYNITSTNFQDSDLKMKGVIKFSLLKGGAGGDPDALPADFKDQFGLAGFPLNRTIATAKTIMGQQTFTSNISDNVDMYLNSLDDETASLISPCYYPDNRLVFKIGTNDNVLRWSDDNSKAYSTSRGCGLNYNVKIVLNGKQADVTIEITERLMAPPFQFLEKDPQPFKNLGTYTVNLNFVQNPVEQLLNMILYSKTAPLPVGSYTVTGDPTLDLKLVTQTYSPHLDMKIPSELYYNAPNIDFKDQTFGAGDTNLSMNSIELQNAPSMFALCVRDKASQTDPSLPIRTFPIKTVSIKLNDTPSILREYSQEDLYAISRRHGYKLGFNSFSGMVLNPGDPAPEYGSNSWFYFSLSDLATDQFMVKNSVKKGSLQITVEVQNDGLVSAPVVELYIVNDQVAVQDARGQFSVFSALIQDEQVLSLPPTYKDMDESDHVLGGSKLGKFWRGLKKVVKVARNLPGVRQMIPKAVHAVADVAGAGKKKASKKGGSVTRSAGKVVRSGGKAMTKAQLKKMYGIR